MIFFHPYRHLDRSKKGPPEFIPTHDELALTKGWMKAEMFKGYRLYVARTALAIIAIILIYLFFLGDGTALQITLAIVVPVLLYCLWHIDRNDILVSSHQHMVKLGEGLSKRRKKLEEKLLEDGLPLLERSTITGELIHIQERESLCGEWTRFIAPRASRGRRETADPRFEEDLVGQ